MNELSVKLENCFGISSMDAKFDFDTAKHCHLIYAPNGTMKSSFASVFEYLAIGETQEKHLDRLDEYKKSSCEVLIDSKQLAPNSIFVSNANSDRNTKEFISTLLVSKDLKKAYDNAHKQLDEKKKILLTQIKAISASKDCEREIQEVFGSEQPCNIYDCLIEIQSQLSDSYAPIDIKYHDIFDSKIEKFIKAHQTELHDYCACYHRLLQESNFYHIIGKTPDFGTLQAKQLSEALKDNAFFNAGHQLKLKDERCIQSHQELAELIEHELHAITENAELKSSFAEIDKALAKNETLRSFKDIIHKQPQLLPELIDYKNFEKRVWRFYFKQVETDLLDVLNEYKKSKEDLEIITEKAKAEKDTWAEIIELFKQRFDVPFTLNLTNKTDLIIKEDLAHIQFLYEDSDGTLCEHKKDVLLGVLSNGERRAFYLLQLLFEIEARRKKAGPHLLILDDIAESFDYKNKYAILEYLYDLSQDPDFRIIILTHNFDFYRLFVSRIGPNQCEFRMAIKDEKGTIQLEKGEYTKNLFAHLKKGSADRFKFIALIPFARNLIEYRKGANDDYGKLTSCLHIKKDSRSIGVQEVVDLLKQEVKINKSPQVGKSNIIEFIYTCADNLANQTTINPIDIENKIVLAIASRLKAEEYMIRHLDEETVNAITSNQSAKLYENFKKCWPNDAAIKTLTKVNIITPEHIHLNTFMYESLIDTPVHRLQQLYKELKALK